MGNNMKYSSELIETKKNIKRLGLIIEEKQHKLNEANFNQLMKDQAVQDMVKKQERSSFFRQQINLIQCMFKVVMWDMTYNIQCSPS